MVPSFYKQKRVCKKFRISNLFYALLCCVWSDRPGMVRLVQTWRWHDLCTISRSSRHMRFVHLRLGFCLFESNLAWCASNVRVTIDRGAKQTKLVMCSCFRSFSAGVAGWAPDRI